MGMKNNDMQAINPAPMGGHDSKPDSYGGDIAGCSILTILGAVLIAGIIVLGYNGAFSNTFLIMFLVIGAACMGSGIVGIVYYIVKQVRTRQAERE